jgi:CPA1 family monovalent cation:H+ antiporter
MKLLSEVLDNIDHTKESSLKAFQGFYLELLEQQRKLLKDMNHRAEFDEDVIRKYLALVDVEEFKLHEKIVETKNE